MTSPEQIDQMNIALCEALGIDCKKDKIRKVSLIISVGNEPRVIVEKYTDEHQFVSIVEIIRTIHLDKPL